jgi:two-component sensor histidine kinase
MQGRDDEALEQLRRQQKALAEFGLEAFRSSDLDATLRRACELVADALEVRLAKVLEVLPGGDRLLVRAGVGWKEGVVGVETLGADHDSPAGYALQTCAPVYSLDTAIETRFSIPPVLLEHGVASMVNVIIVGEGAPFGVFEIDATRPRPFDQDDIAFMMNCANLLAAAIDRQKVHDALEEALSEQRVLAQELAHRVKNMLALVQALTAQAAAEEPAARALRDTLLGRLQALAGAEALLFEEHARTVDLLELSKRALGPFDGAAGRLVVEGRPQDLPARSGRIIALVLHELAANSTKYGALSADGGVARLSWLAEPGGAEPGGKQTDFRLCWEESGGPPVMAPQRRGFGTKLLTSLAEYELDGRAELNHGSSGLTYELVFSGQVG